MILSQILIRISSIFDAIPQTFLPKATHWSAFPVVSLSKPLLGFSFLIFCSCNTTNTIPLETLRHDTLYINKEKYDSIYINRTSDIDRTRDTITITKTMTEYRFRLLRDTISIARIDSIPYEVRIIETKEVRKPPNLFDYLCYLSFGVILGLIGWKMTKLIPSRH